MERNLRLPKSLSSAYRRAFRFKDGILTFKIISGPASNAVPEGPPLFKITTYVVQCSQRQYNRRRAEIDEAAWSALYSTKSCPFDPPRNGNIAAKVINHYGDEVLKVYFIQSAR